MRWFLYERKKQQLKIHINICYISCNPYIFDQLSKIIMVDALKTTKTIPLIKNVLDFIISKIQEQPGECLAVEEYFSLCLLLSLWLFWFISHINCNNKKIYVNAYYNNTSGFRCCWQFYRQAFSWLCKRFYIFQTYQFSCL